MSRFVNVNFTNNRAVKYGGAIYYDTYRPSFVRTTYSNNTAPYGPNVASYPVKVIVFGTETSGLTLNDVASGQKYPKTIKLSLVDFDNQIVTDAISGTVSISPIAGDTNTLGRSSEGLVQGNAQFEEIIFISKPGSKNVTFAVSTNAIPRSKLI